MPEFSSQLVLLIGLGVGVDYALFIVSRHRQGLLAGRDVGSSVVTALDTSGRAVLFAGIIVCFALLGMFALGISFLYGLAIAASIGVLFTMIAALTLLPAMLGFLGPRVLSRRQRRTLATNGPVGTRRDGFWWRWSGTVERHPIVWGLVSLAVVLVLAVPFLSLRLGSSDQGNDPKGTTTRAAYDLLAKGFGPGFNGPLQITAEVRGAGDQAALQRVVDAVSADPSVVSVTPPVVIPAKDGTSVALIGVYPDSAPQDAATTELIDRLRGRTRSPRDRRLEPHRVRRRAHGDLRRLRRRADREASPVHRRGRPAVVPAAGAGVPEPPGPAEGRGHEPPRGRRRVRHPDRGVPVGLAGRGVRRRPHRPVESFLPVMLFAILFGLSMDYEVFLVMRIHEEWLRTGDNALRSATGWPRPDGPSRPPR